MSDSEANNQQPSNDVTHREVQNPAGKRLALALVVCAVLFGAYKGMSQNARRNSNSQDQTSTKPSDLELRCVDAAIDTGFISSTCSAMFLQACMTDRSKSKMEYYALTARQDGTLRGECPNMPRSIAFEKRLKERDRF